VKIARVREGFCKASGKKLEGSGSLDQSSQVLPIQAPKDIPAQPQPACNQVLNPFDPAWNGFRWVGPAVIALDQDSIA
jgi:hypothetical protein